MLQIFFGYGTFIMLQKKSFGQRNFLISCTGSKVPFCQFFNFAKMALLNPCMKLKKWLVFCHLKTHTSSVLMHIVFFGLICCLFFSQPIKFWYEFRICKVSRKKQIHLEEVRANPKKIARKKLFLAPMGEMELSHGFFH